MISMLSDKKSFQECLQLSLLHHNKWLYCNIYSIFRNCTSVQAQVIKTNLQYQQICQKVYSLHFILSLIAFFVSLLYLLDLSSADLLVVFRWVHYAVLQLLWSAVHCFIWWKFFSGVSRTVTYSSAAALNSELMYIELSFLRFKSWNKVHCSTEKLYLLHLFGNIIIIL